MHGQPKENEVNAQREAYDLHHQACRRNAKAALKRGMWKRMWWLRLVFTDTIKRVCSTDKHY
jgi:hypothetical protein